MSTKSFNKSKTFLSQQRSPTMQNTTSPQPIQDVGIDHFSHPQHRLIQVSYPYLFMCMGCKEYGAGRRFRCNACFYDLHEFCALAPPSIKNHSLHNQHQLVFHTKSGGFIRSKCDVCGKATKGYAFRCGSCSFEMHPCCAELSQERSFRVHPHSLKLLPVNSATSGPIDVQCGECKRKRFGRVYRCSICDYHLHAVCAKGMVNGLHDNGIKTPEKKPSMLWAVTQIASHLLWGFVGGLVEGFGEGVASTLVESNWKSKPASRRAH